MAVDQRIKSWLRIQLLQREMISKCARTWDHKNTKEELQRERRELVFLVSSSLLWTRFPFRESMTIDRMMPKMLLSEFKRRVIQKLLHPLFQSLFQSAIITRKPSSCSLLHHPSDAVAASCLLTSVYFQVRRGKKAAVVDIASMQKGRPVIDRPKHKTSRIWNIKSSISRWGSGGQAGRRGRKGSWEIMLMSCTAVRKSITNCSISILW